MHYQIEKYNSESKTWDPYNPTEGKDNNKENVVDPQKWISSEKVEYSLDKSQFNFFTMPRDNTQVQKTTP